MGSLISSDKFLTILLKVVSSKNYGGSKEILIDGYGPGTMALDIYLPF
jgi:hypothetical protein